VKQTNVPLKIVFLVHDIHYGGGGERVTTNLANYFVENGYFVKIVSVSPSNKTNIYDINKKISIEYLDINLNTGSKIIKKIFSVFKVISHFNKYKSTIIVLGIGNYPSLLLSFLPKRTNIKTIGCQHLAFSGIKNIWAILRKIFFRRLDSVVSLTNIDLSKFKKLNNNSIVIPNSILLVSEKIAPLKNKQILFIGRMVSDKGYDLLINVLKKVNKIHPDWNFRIIGDGPLKNNILKEIELSGLKEKVSLLPTTDSIIEEYLNSSIYLMTSRTEGLPMVLLEAQSCGLPIVSFDCETGPSEIVVDNENGFLINCFDIEKMAQKICLLCSDYNLRTIFGKNAVENVKKFSPEAVNLKWKMLFEKIIQ